MLYAPCYMPWLWTPTVALGLPSYLYFYLRSVSNSFPLLVSDLRTPPHQTNLNVSMPVAENYEDIVQASKIEPQIRWKHWIIK